MQKIKCFSLGVYFVLIFIVGCKPNHKYIYEKFNVLYDSNTIVGGISCKISLSGSEQSDGGEKQNKKTITYFKSPYTALVSFYFPKEQSGFIELKSLSFFEGDLKVQTKKVNLKKKFNNKTILCECGIEKIREEERKAFFLIKKIELPHSKLKVKVSLSISTENGEFVKTWVIELIPFTEEKLRNNLLDAIMSV